MAKQQAINYQAKRKQLLREKDKLEVLIRDTTEPQALAALRSDYRKVSADLEDFYDDEKQDNLQKQ